MTRVPFLSSPPLPLRILVAAVAAALVSPFAIGQTWEQQDAASMSMKGEKGTNSGKSGDDKNAPAILNAEEMMGRPDREVVLRREVEIDKGHTTVTSETATYHIVEDEVEAKGNVHMKRMGDTYTADEFKYKMDTGEGFALNPTYRLGTNNGHGTADRVDFIDEDHANVHNGNYSTCEATDPDWYLKANTLELDSGLNEGTAYKGVLYFKGLPILAAPAMSFPLTDERKSGWLPPIFGTTSKGGVELTVPYYFNIAPNRDLTLYPRLIARRGMLLGAEVRYLDSTYSGTTTVEGLQHDRLTNTDRWSISSLHTQNFAPGWTYAWNINAASDDNYPSDFGRSITSASQRLLLRDMSLTYGSTYWTAVTRVSNYQVLQDVNAPIARPYDKLPEFMLTANRYDVGGFDLSAVADATRWWHPDLVRGDRLYVNPQISYPMISPGAFLTPKLGVHASEYSLQDQVPGQPSTISRVLPTFSLDSGLVFERDAQFFGKSMTQTLEPRLFYVYTPYRNQDAIPLFDTGVADLSFAQLFNENQFSGSDRISDANQLTSAVTSRYLEESGLERLRMAVGQRFYFQSPRVGLVPSATSNNTSRSDLLASITGRVTETFSLDSNVQYSETDHIMNRSNYGARWEPAPKKVLNVTYRQDRIQVPQIEQIDVSGQWPISKRWYGAARVNYSLRDRRIAEGLIGVEYKADCWVFRLVAQKIPTSTGTTSTSMFFQLELTGLARLGSNPLEALKNSIPGYQLVTSPDTH